MCLLFSEQNAYKSEIAYYFENGASDLQKRDTCKVDP